MWNHKASSKRIRDQDIMREHIIHREKLSRMSARIDNAPPHDMTHVKINLKGQMIKQSRKDSINTSNRILVKKLMKVSSRTSSEHRPRKAVLSLNASRKFDEVSRITTENFRILNKIKRSKPYYSSERLKKEYRHSRDLKNMISQNAGRVPKIVNFPQGDLNLSNLEITSVKSLNAGSRYDKFLFGL